MLVLSCAVGDRIVVGDDPDTAIVVTVVLNEGRRKIGIDAPRSVPVYREKVAPPGLIDALATKYKWK